MEDALHKKVLIVSNKPPYPVVDGGCFAMSKFEQLVRSSVEDVFYFAISTPKHPFVKDALPENWKADENFFTGFIDTQVKNKHVLKFMAGSSIRASRFYHQEIEKRILDLIEKKNIDLVIFESIYAAIYLQAVKKKGVKAFIRTHNIEHQIWEKYYEGMVGGLKKTAYKSETSRLRSFEEKLLEQSDGNIFISKADLRFSRENLGLQNGIYIPVQMQSHPFSAKEPSTPLKLFHIGAMDWLPNIKGIEKFILHIFPAILERFPATELHLAGKSMPDSFYQYQSNHIFIHGQVKEATEFIQPYDVSVVPVESGSGIRIKILEAMAAGKPVITTSTGIEGIEADNGKEYMLANDLDGWIHAIDYLSNPTAYDNIARLGMEFIKKNYSGEALKGQLIPFIRNQIATND